MSYRFMRTLVFFDLPVETIEDQRNYRKFRKILLQSGFIMLQKSVYSRMLTNPSAGHSVLETIRKNKPPVGLVQVLTVTEKQFSRMEYITGEFSSDIVDGHESLVIL